MASATNKALGPPENHHQFGVTSFAHYRSFLSPYHHRQYCSGRCDIPGTRKRRSDKNNEVGNTGIRLFLFVMHMYMGP